MTDIHRSFSQLEQGHFQDLSLEYFGSFDYGKSTADFLRQHQFDQLDRVAPVVHGALEPEEELLQTMTAAEDEWCMLPNGVPPFEVALHKSAEISPDNGWHAWDVGVGPLTAYSLGRFMRQRGLKEHTFQGSVGKMLDLLNIASGTTRIQTPETPDSTVFLDTATDLQALFEQAGISEYSRTDLKKKVSKCLRAQLDHGKVDEHVGEMVVEGRLTFLRSSIVPAKIAVHSLAALTKVYKPSHPLHNFLRNF